MAPDSTDTKIRRSEDRVFGAIKELGDQMTRGFERQHHETANLSERVAELHAKVEAKPQECNLHLDMIKNNQKNVADAHARIDTVDAKIWPSVIKGVTITITIGGTLTGIVFGIVHLIKEIAK
jgi:hypothetical protein